MKRIFLGILFVGIFSLSSCIQTSDPDTPKRVSFLLNVDNVGNILNVGQDTIEVSEIKFLADKFNLVLIDEAILQTDVDALAMIYRSQFAGQDENVLSANIGFEDINRFRGMELFIDQPKDDDNIQDNDFFGETTNYSLIIKGIYNSSDFTFRSEVSFTKTFDFESVIELSDDEETLVLRVVTDIRELLIDQDANQIFDPQKPENKATIDSLFENSITVEAFNSDIF